MSDSDTTHAGEDNTEDASTGPNRRRVLQGIGAAGAAIAVGAGGHAGAESPGSGGGVVRDSHTQLEDDGIPVSAQFFSFTESDKSEAELIQECSNAGYHAVEPYQLNDLDAIASALDDTGLEMGTAHVNGIVGQIEDDPAAVADAYREFDVVVLVNPIEDSIDWTSRSAVEGFADRMSSAASDLADEGLGLGYHNHDHEFQEVGDGTIAYDVFAENVSDVHLQIDAGWVLAGGEDPIQYIIDYADKVGSIHMKNVMDGEPTEIDEGLVGMRGVATAARRAADVDYLIYEYDNAPNPMESLQTGSDWLNKLNAPWDPSGICAVQWSDIHPAKLSR